jgi:hypothetical protein
MPRESPYLFAAQGWRRFRSDAMWSASGASDFFYERLPGLEERERPGRPRAFPPEVVVSIKAIACEPSADRELPLSRLSSADIALAA